MITADKTKYRTHYALSLSEANIGEVVTVAGFVQKRREHGEHLAFIDLRDSTGVIQCVVEGTLDLRSEYVLSITGTVFNRPDGTVNEKLETGEIEIRECTVHVHSKAKTPPFQVESLADTDENLRLKYRYLDIRSSRLQNNLRLRSQINQALREAMYEQGFVEVETPLLWTPTPEGAREFIVPSRLHRSKFYALPQSPQLAKQLLMVGGIDRYFQIARCLRDEDLRADRQFEFSQLDVEASFVDAEDVMRFISYAVEKAHQVAFGDKKLNILSMTWSESIERFGTDKPDLRIPNELTNVTKIFENSHVKALNAESVVSYVVPSSVQLSRSQLDQLVESAKLLGAKGLLWMRVKRSDSEIEKLHLDSPISKVLESDVEANLIEALNLSESETVLLVADKKIKSNKILGQIRTELGKIMLSNISHRDDLKFSWITEFPFFESLDQEGNPIPAHHPFTMPNLDDIHLFASDPLSVRSSAYDLVCNGLELGSGSIRIHDREIQSKVFKAIGLSEESANEKFAFLLDAFSFGAPPHGGFAIGIDRLVQIFAGEESIRDVIAFPKTGNGSDLMCKAPSEVEANTLRDLNIRVVQP